ncbi:prolyl oligopeptidase family serine peptidase [Candidatus Bathyarchaeota archaeon]|nr:prolyl oligopeptidase family serine peptidase [Candidatus Bathyarchaeota archaeon]
MSDSKRQTEHTYVREMRYLLYLPDGYDVKEGRLWPLLVFLHGAGERGDDLELVKKHGPPKLIEGGCKLPFIVVSPQLPAGEWWSPDMVAWLAKDAIDTHMVDRDRVYLTGLSMGGYGTWATSIKYPDLFAAIAPICGGGDPTKASEIKRIPTWIFHGAKDPIVPVGRSEEMYEALKPYGNARLTVYSDAEHDSWTEAYGSEELYTWLLSHRRGEEEPK